MRDLLRLAVPAFAALALIGCATKVAVTDQLPGTANLPDGQGIVIGSILMTTPSGVNDHSKLEMIDALRRRKLTATFRSYVMHGPPGGGVSWREYVGDKYVVQFSVDAERRFVIRAPTGTYELQKLVASSPGIFGEENGCHMDDVAAFEIRAGKAIYVGKLVVTVGFKTEQQVKWARGVETATSGYVIGMPERFLDMRLGTTDSKEAALRDLASDPSRLPGGVESELMRTGIPRWLYEPPPKAPPPQVPRKKGR